MKNIALALFITILVSACSSGSTVAEIPFNVTGIYRGTFENTADTQSGNITLNIVEDDSGDIVGNIIFESDGRNCLINGGVTGQTLSFSVLINVDQSSTVTTTTTTVTTDDVTGEETSNDETSTETLDGSIEYTMTQSSNGSRLSGTYITTGDFCSNSTGSGTVELFR